MKLFFYLGQWGNVVVLTLENGGGGENVALESGPNPGQSGKVVVLIWELGDVTVLQWAKVVVLIWEMGQCYCATVGKSSCPNLGKWGNVTVLQCGRVAMLI